MAPSECCAFHSRDLESTLEDGTVLDAFKRWIREESGRSKDPLDLYFAIKVFRNMIDQEDPKSVEIACKIHRRYISIKTGTCTFIPDAIRKVMSERVHALSSTNPPRITFFDPCIEHVLSYLRKQHALFISSQHFLELNCQSVHAEDAPSTSYVRNGQLPLCQGYVKCSSNAAATEWMRRIGKTARFARSSQPAFSQGVKTSKNASAVSSSFSGDEGSRRPFRRQFDRIHPHDNFPNAAIEDYQFIHEYREGRERFVQILTEKLQFLKDRIDEHKRETGEEIFARDLDYWRNADNYAKDLCKGDDSALSDDDSLDKYERKMNANTERNPVMREDRHRSPSASPVRFTNRNTGRNMSVANPYGEHGFAPPPGGLGMHERYNFAQTRIPHGLRSSVSSGGYGGHRLSDSSGFCSSESANIVNRAALFQKARNLASQGYAPQHATMGRRDSPFVAHAHHAIATLPRQDRYIFGPIQQQQVLTVSYKEQHGEAPFVAKMEMRELTFREFRRCFGISSRSNKMFFFKSECEDGSAPYQWTIIDNDSAVLPIFEGRITAECRSCSESD